MLALVPRVLLDDLNALMEGIPARLVPYDEDSALPPEVSEAEAVFRTIAGTAYARIIAEGPNIRWLHTASAGVDHVLVPAVFAKTGLIVTDSGEAFPPSLSEFVLAWMLTLTHRVPDFLALQQERRWQWTVHGELSGQTVGVIGLGPIGRGIATRCRMLGMTALGHRRSDTPCPEVDALVALETLLSRSDWVVLACALTPETRGLLGERELSLLKPTARLINVARGPIVNEEALTEVLQAGRIGGAVLDVFDTEPLPAENPLWGLPNVYITCHSSGWTEGLRRRQRETFIANLRRFIQGEPLQGIVDIERGY
jgi:phosphoglycerate dehydrogenase-like enzyme